MGSHPDWAISEGLFLHISLRLITFGGCLAHLAYLVHKSHHKTAKYVFNKENLNP